MGFHALPREGNGFHLALARATPEAIHVCLSCECRRDHSKNPHAASYEQLVCVSVIQDRPKEKFEVNCVRP